MSRKNTRALRGLHVTHSSWKPVLSQEVAHRQQLSNLISAWEESKKRSELILEQASKDQQITDLDAPLADEKLADLQFQFLHCYPYLTFPPRSFPSSQLISRLWREKKRLVHVAHPLGKVHNDFLKQGSLPAYFQNTLGPMTFSQNKRELENVEVKSLIDALIRVELLFLAYCVIGCEAHSDGEPWFSFPEHLEHLDYLRYRALGGNLTGTQVFMQKELLLRAQALSYVKDRSKGLSLGKALAKARLECGDLWNGLYKESQGIQAASPLYVDPLTAQAIGAPLRSGQLAIQDIATPGKQPRCNSFPGAHRPSQKDEQTKDGRPAPLKAGLTACTDQVALDPGGFCNICKAFASGKGCSKWPCGGAHCCDIKLKNGTRCLGDHSRVNCPHNRG